MHQWANISMSTVTSEKKPFLNREYEETLKNVRSEMLSFGKQIHEYLEHIRADVDDYKFVVERHGDGIEIEVRFKAYVHPSKIATANEVVSK